MNQIIWILLLSITCSIYCQYVEDQTFVINMRTGRLYPPTVPIPVYPGDHILLCAPPGLSSACHTMVNSTCLTLRNGCVTRKIDNRYSHGSLLYFQSNEPTLYKNKVQPREDPLVHCLILFGRHKTLFSHCVKTFSKFENVTDGSTDIDIGPGYKSIILAASPQVSVPFHKDKTGRIISFICQIVFVLLTIPLFFLQGNICNVLIL